MPQTIRGRVCRNDFIAVGQTCGTENAVAVAVPGPTPLVEVFSTSNAIGYGLERNAQASGGSVLYPNPERLVGV